MISRKNGTFLSQLLDRRHVFAHFGFQEACFLFRIHVHCSGLFQARIPQEISPRTSELGFEFVTVLLSLLQLIFNVVHILGFTLIDESKHIHYHIYRFSALQLPSNLSNLAL